MQKLVFTNGGGQSIDLTSGNFGITNWEGLSGVSLNIQTQQVPFQDGGVFLDALMEQREISVTVAIQDNNDLSARYELKRQLISALNPKLGEGVLVYTNDYLSRQIKAVPQLPIFENKNSNDAGTLKASVVFSCPSPYWEDLEETVVDLGLSEIKTINNEGDVPTQVEISLLGESVNPNIVNNTTEQNIQYIGTMNGKININTNFGKKGAIKITEGTDIVISRAKLNFIKCIYVSRYGKYFAIFENGCFGSSQDGIQWQIKKVANGLHLYDFCYSLEKNIFVLTGDGEIITSSDAENWKYIDTSNSKMFGVTYNADTGDFVATGRFASYKSTDGENWERTTMLATILGNITTNGQIYVTVVKGTGKVRTSSNGTSFSTDYATGITSITQIFYSKKNNLFVVIGTGGEIATSTNGTSWTTRTSGTTQNLNNISEDKSGNIFVVGENGTVLKSTDGTSWSSVDSGVSATLNTFVANGSIDEYIIGGNDFIILKSYDLVNWEVYELEATDFKSCTYCKNIGKYVVVGTGGIIMSSRDGMLWNKETSPVNTDLLSVCYSEQKKIIVAVGANGRIITSQDAENWTIRNTNIASQLNAVIYDPTREKFFVAGNDNKVLTSQDAENWTTQTVGTGTKDFISIATSNNMILLLTELFIFKSTDGNTFTQTIDLTGIGTGKAVIYHKVLGVFAILAVQSNYSASVVTKDGENGITGLIANSIIGNNMFYSEELNQVYVVANYGNILKSSDLYNWSSIRNTVIKNLYGASFSNIKDLIFCGEDNSIIDITGEKEENVIQNISLTSDFGFRLNQGENKLTLLENSGVLSAIIKYRQKYIGV